MNKFEDEMLIKAFVFDDKFGNGFTFERGITSNKLLRHKYHGQTHFIYPFVVNNDKNKTIILTEDSNTNNGCFVISKRALKERYPYLKRVAAIEAKKVADNCLRETLNKHNGEEQ